MLSDECNFNEFIEKVQANDIMELMYLTEKEATEAERLRYRSNVPLSCREKCGTCYAETLKNFLFYLRYRIRLNVVSDEIFDTFLKASVFFTKPPIRQKRNLFNLPSPNQKGREGLY